MRTATPMLLSDEDLRYREANPVACRFFGRSREELLEMRIGDLTPPGHLESVEGRIQAFRREGTLSGRVIVLAAGNNPVEVDFSATADIVPGLHLTVLSAPGSDSLLGEGAEPDEPQGDRLSPREREVLTALAVGRTGAEIADDLVLSPETVRNHIRNARAKLGARTRAQAIAIALQSGEISV
jgi:DNA-binding CsgD family transcriptional regulator